MNDGWLCDSILKTAASPSPMSTAPAFSPGPAAPAARRSAASSGGRASSCSCSARTTSPRRCRARSGSARGRGTRRCDRTRRASARGVREPVDRSSFSLARLGQSARRPVARAFERDARSIDSKIDAAVDAAEQRFARALRMRHHADDVARLVAEAGDRVHRSVRIPRIVDAARRIGVAEDDLPVGFEPFAACRAARSSCLRRAPIGIRSTCPAWRGAGERRVGLLDAHVDVLAAVLQRRDCAASRPGSRPASSRI